MAQLSLCGDVLALLSHSTKEHPLALSRLCKTFDINEVQMCDLIQELREKGHRIVYDASGNNAWVAQTDEEFRPTRFDMIQQIGELMRTLVAMEDECEPEDFNLSDYIRLP